MKWTPDYLCTKFSDPSFSTANRCLDSCDVYLLHLHHRIECAFGNKSVTACERFREDDWRYLPVNSPAIPAPTAVTLLAAVSDDCIPVAVGLGVGVAISSVTEGIPHLPCNSRAR